MQKLTSIFEETLGIDKNDLNDATSSENFERWDSLGHLMLISRLEEEFGVEFNMDQVAEMKSFGAIKKALTHLGVQL